MAKLVIDKVNGLFDLRPIYEFLQSKKDGKFMVEVKRIRRPRSDDQNGWLWGCIYPLLLDAINDAGWEFTDIEQIHEFFKAQFTAQKVVNKDTGEIIQFPSSTARMDTVTFSSYCEQLRGYAKEYLGVDIPDPDKEWWKHENNTKQHGE